MRLNPMRYQPTKRALKFISIIPICYFMYTIYKWTLKSINPKYKIKKGEGFNIFGYHFAPKKTFIEKLRLTMGWMIHEALDDEKVTKSGLNFLD